MKNKTFTYLLLIVVAVIWYQVFYRVSGNLFGENEVVLPSVSQSAPLLTIERDTFALVADYRDPFGEIKHVPRTLEMPNRAEEVKQRTPKPTKPKVVWPPIEYYGIVKKTESNKPLAILKIDGIQLMVRGGEELFDGIVLKAVARDSIHIVYKRERRTFYRN